MSAELARARKTEAELTETSIRITVEGALQRFQVLASSLCVG